MRITVSVLLLSTICMAGCNSGEDSDILIINLNDARKNPQEVLYSEVVKRVEYIQPELTDRSFIAWSSNCIVSDEYLFLKTGSTSGSILCFRRNGEFVGTVGRSGKGPNEYVSPYNLCLSPDQKYLFWLDNRLNRVTRFSLKDNKLKQASITGVLSLTDMAVDENHVFICTLPDADAENPVRVIELDFDLNRTDGYLPTNRVPEEYFPQPNHLALFNNQFYLNSLESDEILIHDKKFRLKKRIGFTGLLENQELNGFKFWGDRLIAEFRGKIQPISGTSNQVIIDLGLTNPANQKVLFDLGGNCCNADFIDDITGMGHESRFGMRTQLGYLENHLPIENVQRKIRENDPGMNKIDPILKKLIIDSDPYDNPIIRIYWMKQQPATGNQKTGNR